MRETPDRWSMVTAGDILMDERSQIWQVEHVQHETGYFTMIRVLALNLQTLTRAKWYVPGQGRLDNDSLWIGES
jgi:hypothetical protein